MVRVAGVRFKTAGKVYYFDPGEINVKAGDNVIVETARGMEFGTVTMDITEWLLRCSRLLELPMRKTINSTKKMYEKNSVPWSFVKKK